MTERCKKHEVDYTPIKANGREIGMHCPQCALEHIESLAGASVREGAEVVRESELQARRRKLSERLDRVGIPPRFQTRRFSNYVTESPEQEKALGRCKRYADSLCEKGFSGGLILIGNVGNGKNHLACAIANQYQATGADVVFTTLADMVSKIRESYNPGSQVTELQAIRAFRDIDLLVLDEVGLQKGDKAEINLITRVLNDRYGWMKPTVLVSNMKFVEMGDLLGERIIDRMREDGGAIVQFTWESFRSRAEKVHRK